MFDFIFGKKDGGSSGGKGAGGGPQGPKNSTAMQSVDDAIDLLEKKEALLQKKADAELAKAKEWHSKKNTSRALECMKRKKTYEEQMSRLTAQKTNLETQRFALENQQLNLELVNAQKKAAEELKKSNKKLNADKIEDQMDSLMEEMDKANQVSEALANPIDVNAGAVDEDELMMELEMELNNGEQEGEDSDLIAQLNKVKIPNKKENSGMTKEDAYALAQLESELAS